MTGDVEEGRAFGTPDRRHIRLAQPGDRLDQRLEHGLKIEGRAADDLEHLGGGGLLISELILTYDDQPVFVVSIMEFEDGKVVGETQYFGGPFEPGPSRAQWVERIA